MSKIKLFIIIIAAVLSVGAVGAGVFFALEATDTINVIDSVGSLLDDTEKDEDEDEKKDSDGKEEDKTDEEEETTVTEIEMPSEADIVSDADIELVSYGSVYFCYHIPQINYPTDEISAVNDEIRRYYTELAAEQTEHLDEYGIMSVGDVAYIYGVKDNVVSIAVKESFAEYFGCNYTIYNVDVKTGKMLTDSEVLEIMGLSEEDFREDTKSAMQLYYDNASADDGYSYDEYAQESIDYSLSDECIAQARPVIDIDGSLCAVTEMLIVGGINTVKQIICLDSSEIYEILYCDDEHTDVLYKDLPANERDAAVLYTEYLTDKGHLEITGCSSSIYYYYNISSCFADFIADETPELLIVYEKKEYNYDVAGAFYAAALLSIQDGKVFVSEIAENWGGSGGGGQLSVVYDSLFDAPVVLFSDLQRAGYAYNTQTYRAHTKDSRPGEAVDSYSSYYIYIEEFTQADIDAVKSETDYWKEDFDECSFTYYKCNEEYITAEEFDEFFARFEFDETVSGYELKTVSELKPVY